MRFMMIYKPADTTDMEAGVPPTQEEIAKMGKFIEEMAKSGVLLATDGLQPSSKGARVRLSGGKLTVTDGPFTETKELIAPALQSSGSSRRRRRSNWPGVSSNWQAMVRARFA